MPRLNQERQNELEPQRAEYALKALKKYSPIYFEKCITFLYKDNLISFWPYSGWHSGKGIVAGRGLNKLLNQLKK